MIPPNLHASLYGVWLRLTAELADRGAAVWPKFDGAGLTPIVLLSRSWYTVRAGIFVEPMEPRKIYGLHDGAVCAILCESGALAQGCPAWLDLIASETAWANRSR